MAKRFYHIRLGPVPKGTKKRCFITKDVGKPERLKIVAVYTPPKGMSCKTMRRKRAGEFEYIQKAIISKSAWGNKRLRQKYLRYFRKKHRCRPRQMPRRSRFELICK